VRQHVNPLARELQIPLPPPDWAATFDDPTLPLFLDVGCGPGRFALAHAAKHPAVNVYGLEIRARLVDRAREWAATAGVAGRAAFAVANATVSLPAGLLTGYPGPLTCVAVQFPDPHFKERHKKRRVVQPAMATAVAAALAPGGRVFLQSDVLDAAVSMRATFEEVASDVLAPCRDAHGGGGRPWAAWADAGWLETNPLGVPTEREVDAVARGLPVYRCLLVKKE
jgi:tRNA (guanine-N7-)-methyltransferase